MPEEFLAVIRLFHQAGLRYSLFKCEHILAGTNSNPDLLFLRPEDYHAAASLLEHRGYLRHLSERVERYKQMHVCVLQGEIFAVHLHREIAWHNVRIFSSREKEKLFSRQREAALGIFLPSPEDQLLIHAAHVIFENFRIRERERLILQELCRQGLDWNYLYWTAQAAGFDGTLRYLLQCHKEGKQPRKGKLYWQFFRKILHTPVSWLPVTAKVLRSAARRISVRRRGCLIALIGVPGAGKTTLARELYEKYRSTASFFSGRFGYYFGWVPFSPHARIISALMKKKGRRIFDEFKVADNSAGNHGPSEIRGDPLADLGLADERPLAESSPVRWPAGKRAFSKKFSGELLFLYNYLEYQLRYWLVIFPRLRKGKLVITDRFFYDLYAQYRQGRESRLLEILMRFYPPPDHLFVLDAPLKVLAARGKNPAVFSTAGEKISKAEFRNEPDLEDLSRQRARYGELAEKFSGSIILNYNSDAPARGTLSGKTDGGNSIRIIQETWKTLVRNHGG